MITETAGSRRSQRRGAGLVRGSLLVVVALSALVLARPVVADEPKDEAAAGIEAELFEPDNAYEPSDAGNPLRVLAYALHPVGVILDTLIFRPAYWLGSHEPIKTLVGQTD